MISGILSRLQGMVSHAYIKIILIIALLATIGFNQVGNYGISADESIGINMVYWNRDLILKGKEIPWLFKYDGTVFNFASEAAFQLYKRLPSSKSGERKKELSLRDRFVERIRVKHYLTFLTSLVAYISVAIIVSILGGLESAWLGPVILWLMPRFWGHSFFNFKDIPFAALFIVCTLVGSYLLKQYLSQDRPLKLKFNLIVLLSIIEGILIGLLTGIRFGGFFVLFFIPFTHAIIKLLEKRNPWSDFYQLFWGYSWLFISWLVTTILVYPASWSQPIAWMLETLTALSKYGWSGTVLFDGEFISAQAVPWYYLPRWIFITVPFIFQVTFLGGIAVIIGRYRRLSYWQKACAILLLLQIFFIPFVTIIKGSTMYDEMRHFLFIIPGISILSSICFIWLFKRFKNCQFPRVFLTTILLIAFWQISSTMHALHPYEYIYFNRISGGLASAYNRYETDYWGLSMREGMEWLNQNAQPRTKVIVAGPLHSAQAFAREDLRLIPYNPSAKINWQESYYYLARPRWDLPQKFPECPIAYQVQREGIPLTVVKRCN